jgi:hypothetical protein
MGGPLRTGCWGKCWGPYREEVTGRWRMLHDEEVNYLSNERGRDKRDDGKAPFVLWIWTHCVPSTNWYLPTRLWIWYKMWNAYTTLTLRHKMFWVGGGVGLCCFERLKRRSQLEMSSVLFGGWLIERHVTCQLLWSLVREAPASASDGTSAETAHLTLVADQLPCEAINAHTCELSLRFSVYYLAV